MRNLKYLLFGITLFSIYTYFDNFGYQNYKMLYQAFGLFQLVATITLNVLLSVVSTFSVYTAFTNSMVKIDFKGATLSTVGNIIAIFFTGCTSCGLSIFAALGLSFTAPLVTPGAIEYKAIALVVLLIGLYFIDKKAKNGKCKVKI